MLKKLKSESWQDINFKGLLRKSEEKEIVSIFELKSEAREV